MRVTIDCDGNSKIMLLWRLFKGFLVTKKFPEEIRRTRRGYHAIWRGLKIDMNKVFVYRMFIGDDCNRLKMDMLTKIMPQILFSEKQLFVRHYGCWVEVKYCRICKEPLTDKFVWRFGKYYCAECGKGNVILKELLQDRKEDMFNNLLSKISQVRCLYDDNVSKRIQ
jgi:hypothetical protein